MPHWFYPGEYHEYDYHADDADLEDELPSQEELEAYMSYDFEMAVFRAFEESVARGEAAYPTLPAVLAGEVDWVV